MNVSLHISGVTLGSVGSQTQLSLRCNFSDYLFRNNYMFRPMTTILVCFICAFFTPAN